MPNIPAIEPWNLWFVQLGHWDEAINVKSCSLCESCFLSASCRTMAVRHQCLTANPHWYPNDTPCNLIYRWSNGNVKQDIVQMIPGPDQLQCEALFPKLSVLAAINEPIPDQEQDDGSQVWLLRFSPKYTVFSLHFYPMSGNQFCWVSPSFDFGLHVEPHTANAAGSQKHVQGCAGMQYSAPNWRFCNAIRYHVHSANSY